jgi:hypothetical protein
MTRTWTIVIWLLAAAAAASLLARLAPFARAQVVDGPRVSEILAGPARDWDGDGAYDARKDEWVELVNAGFAAIDLAAYRLADQDSTIRYELSGILQPESALLITGSMAETQQRSLGRTVGGLSLNNAGDSVLLFRIDGADTVLVDSHKYNSIEAASDRSTGWIGDPAMWVLFDALNRYTGSGEPKGNGCAPTPGIRNACPTPVTGTTWGKIKKLMLERR